MKFDRPSEVHKIEASNGLGFRVYFPSNPRTTPIEALDPIKSEHYLPRR